MSSTTTGLRSWARTAAKMGSRSVIAPVTLETWVSATTRVRLLIAWASSSGLVSMRPSGVSSSQRSFAPVRWARICQGTRLAWCSAGVTRISSTAPRFRSSGPSPPATPWEALPMPSATRLMASVAFLVNTSCWGRASTKLATAARASSQAAVARSASS